MEDDMAVPITDVREISRIAYGFMGSKALWFPRPAGRSR